MGSCSLPQKPFTHHLEHSCQSGDQSENNVETQPPVDMWCEEEEISASLNRDILELLPQQNPIIQIQKKKNSIRIGGIIKNLEYVTLT